MIALTGCKSHPADQPGLTELHNHSLALHSVECRRLPTAQFSPHLTDMPYKTLRLRQPVSAGTTSNVYMSDESYLLDCNYLCRVIRR